MEDRNYYMDQKIDNSGVADIKRFSDLSDLYRTKNPTFLLEESKYRPNSGTYFGASDSKFDKRLPSVDYLLSQDLTADQARAEEQGFFNRIGNALVNNAVIAGTTAIGGTIGTLYGAIDALANQELTKLWDNPVNRKMLEWQEAAAQAAPNYYKKGYEESSIWKKLGTSIFWADLIKNLGYTEGMLIPGMGVSSALSRTPMIVQAMGSAVTGAISEASIEALQAKTDKLSLEDMQIAESFNKMMREAKTPEEKAFIEKEYNRIINENEKDANQVGNYVLGYNMALLTATNALEWGKLFTRGNKASRAAILAKERSKGIKVSEEELKLDLEKPWLNTAKNLGERGYQAFAEGSEEVLQDIAVRSADLNPKYNTFNESIFNSDKRKLAENSIQSLGMAFSQAMKDPETATNFAMGFLTSVVGSPRLRTPKENGEWRSPVTMEGGITEFLREKKDYNRKRNIVNDINERLSDPKFKEYYDGLVRDMSLTEKANQALEIGDEFNFQNYQFASMVSDIIMLDNVGHTDILDNIIDKSSNMSDAEIQELINSGLFQQNGNPMKVEDARQKIQENAAKMKALAEQFREMKEALEASKNGSEFSKEALENIIFAKMQIDNWKQRQESITKEITDLYHSLISMMNEEDVLTDSSLKLMSILPSTRTQLKDVIKDSDLTDDLKESWISKLDDLDKIQDSIESFSSKINEYYNSPVKANKEQNKLKENALKKEKKAKTNSVKEKLAEASSPKHLRSIIRNLENDESIDNDDIEKAINELDEEGNQIVKENSAIHSVYQGAISKLTELGLSQSEKSDAISMLRTAMESSSSMAEMIEPTNSAYTQMNKFFTPENPSSENAKENSKRFFTTQAAVYKALNKQLLELGKNQEAAKFITRENPNNTTFPESSSTGNSGVTTAPSVNTDAVSNDVKGKVSEEGEVGVYSGDIEDNKLNSEYTNDINTESSQREEMISNNNQTSWSPLSWYFLGAKKEGKLIPISETEKIQARGGRDSSINFGSIPQWIKDNNVQEYVDSGKLKIGDKLVIGIPSDLKDINGNPVLVYYKEDGTNKIPVGIFIARSDAEKSVKNLVLSEYNSSNKDNTFYSSYSTTVNDIKFGYIEYSGYKDLSNTSDDNFLVVIKNGSLVIGKEGIKQSDIHRPYKITNKNGSVFIAVPNARKGMSSGYDLVGLRIKGFNKKDFPLDSDSTTKLKLFIRSDLSDIINSKTQKELIEAVKNLSTLLYLPHYNFYITKEGKIRITQNVLDKDNNFVKKKVTRADGTIEFVNKEVVAGVFDNVDSLFNFLYSANLRFQISANLLKDKSYTDLIIKSRILATNASELKSKGGWFTVNPLDANGKEIEGSKIPFNSNPKNTPKTENNSIIVSINGKQITLFPGGEFLSLADGQKKLPNNPDTAERYKILYNLQKQYGDVTEGATMWNNKAVVGDRVIDRTIGKWITGKEADEVKNKVNSVKNTPKSNINTEIIDDSSEESNIKNGELGYYLDSRDNRIHKTSMLSVGEILGIPVKLIKIPVKTSGLNPKGPKKLAGYNYGIVLPNGHSYIGKNLAPEMPVESIFSGIKASFEGPGSGPKGKEFVEKHKKEFEELKSLPAISIPESKVSDPIIMENEESLVESTKENSVPSAISDEMSFDDFAASLGVGSTKYTFGSPKLREKTVESKVWNKKEELSWLAKTLPNIPVEVREGILHVAKKNAWGIFDKSGIILSDIAAEGTAYHEAFHAVFSLGLNAAERTALIEEAKNESGLSDSVETEEWLAERFREFVINNKTKSIGQKIKRFFRKLWNMIRGVQEASTMKYSIFNNIASGKYKNLSNNISRYTRNTNKDNSIFEENGYPKEWIENASAEEKRVARICIGM